MNHRITCLVGKGLCLELNWEGPLTGLAARGGDLLDPGAEIVKVETTETETGAEIRSRWKSLNNEVTINCIQAKLLLRGLIDWQEDNSRWQEEGFTYPIHC